MAPRSETISLAMSAFKPWLELIRLAIQTLAPLFRHQQFLVDSKKCGHSLTVGDCARVTAYSQEAPYTSLAANFGLAAHQIR